MDLQTILPTVKRIKGATFASLDAVTMPSPGIRQVSRNVRVILFVTKGKSGYEAMVNRRLAEAGLPSDFVVGDLPWGVRLDGTPIIQHNGRDYLQSVVLDKGASEYYIGSIRVDPKGLNLASRSGQGLPEGRDVMVAAYELGNIRRLALMGEEFVCE